jgi:hypothetical protein
MMASVKGAEGIGTQEPHHDSHNKPAADATKASNQEEAKKAVNKAEHPEALTEKQVARAASEYMVALRPQPWPVEMQSVLTKLAEKDDKGKLKLQAKSTDDVPAAVDAALAELTKAA